MIFTREQWFSLPLPLRLQWWRETDYSRNPLAASDELRAAINAALAPQDHKKL